jgi:hypothetical protein
MEGARISSWNKKKAKETESQQLILDPSEN